MKHNNVLPNGHFHKKWQTRVKTWFAQPMQKKQRRLTRQAKAAAMAPRPTERLRPAVHCPTIKYNRKVKLGRGFTVGELKGAGISKKVAQTIGIAVDYRRTNKAVETFNTNVERLKEYKAKLIIFPKGSNQKPKAGDSPASETGSATQVVGPIMPVDNKVPEVALVAVTDEMKGVNARSTLRMERNEQKLRGIRIRMAEDKKRDEK